MRREIRSTLRPVSVGRRHHRARRRRTTGRDPRLQAEPSTSDPATPHRGRGSLHPPHRVDPGGTKWAKPRSAKSSSSTSSTRRSRSSSASSTPSRTLHRASGREREAGDQVGPGRGREVPPAAQDAGQGARRHGRGRGCRRRPEGADGVDAREGDAASATTATSTRRTPCCSTSSASSGTRPAGCSRSPATRRTPSCATRPRPSRRGRRRPRRR